MARQSLLESPILLLKPLVLPKCCAEFGLDTAGIWHTRHSAQRDRHARVIVELLILSLRLSEANTFSSADRPCQRRGPRFPLHANDVVRVLAY